MRLTLASSLQTSALALLLAAPTGLFAQNNRPLIGPEPPPNMRPAKEAVTQEVKQLEGMRRGALDNSPDASVPAGTVLGPNIRPGITAHAALTFESTFVDFGDVEEGKTVTARFPFSNTSDQTVTITNTHTTCGCTVAKLDKKVFAPGEGDVVEIAFNSTGRPGMNDRIIRVETDEPGVSSYAVRLRANVTQEVWLSQRVAAFGEVPVGETKTVTVNLLSIADNPVEVLGLVNARGDVLVEAGNPRPYNVPGKAQSGVQIPITVTLPGDRAAGRVGGSIAVRTNLPAPHNSFNISYSGNVVGSVTYSPARLYFGVVPPNSKQMTRGSISVTKGDDAFELESWEVLPLKLPNSDRVAAPAETLPRMTITIDKPADDTTVQGLTAVAELSEHLGHLQGTLALKGRIGDKPETLQIPFSLYVRDLPALQQSQTIPEIPARGFTQQRPVPQAPGS